MSAWLARWIPLPLSSYAADIDGLFWLIYWIVGVWFMAAEVALVWFVIRYRRKPGRRAAYLTGESRTELAWLLVPAAVVLVLDLAIDGAGGRVWAKVKGDLPATDLHVRVTGKQFNWEVRYPGPDGRFDTADDRVTDNDLRVPAGRPVRLTLGATDVVHSFFLPHARLKQDVVPGREIAAWFDAATPGTYEIACAELCGFGHYTMRGRLIVQTAEEWAAWVEQQWPGS